MGKLHELLAIEGDLKGKRDKIREETIITFAQKGAHFEGWTKQLKMFDESQSQEDSVEQQKLTTTVKSKLDYMKDAFIQLWDAKLQKEKANQLAKSNIRINELSLDDLPVTFLLGMESELTRLREVFNTIPTLPPGVDWQEDKQGGSDVFKSMTPLIKKKTQKKVIPLVLAEATKEHKAQVTTVTEDRPVGDIIYEKISGMISPAQKNIYLDRIDRILTEFKKARQRANTIDTPTDIIGEKIFDFILA